MPNTAKLRFGSPAKRAVLTVGKGGRGFIIETRDGSRLVLTAAHCLPAIPEAHPWADDRTARLVAPHGRKLSIIADYLFVDPVADIAVLGRPSDDNLAKPYDTFVDAQSVLAIGCLPQKLFAELDGWLLARDGAWFRCTMRYRNDGGLWLSNIARPIVGGMSGSPILAANGSAVGLIPSSNVDGSESGPNPRFDCHLPGWLLRNAVTKSVRSRASAD